MVLFPPEVWDIIKQRMHHLLWLEAQRQHKMLMYYRFQSMVCHRDTLENRRQILYRNIRCARENIKRRCQKCKIIPTNTALQFNWERECYCYISFSSRSSQWKKILDCINQKRITNGKLPIR